MQETILRCLRTYARRTALGLVLAGAIVMLAGAAPAASATGTGGAPCVDCHDKAAAAFESSFHAKIWRGANGCPSCHGPTDQHLTDPSKNTIISFGKDSGRSAEEMSRQCLGCHQKISAQLAQWDLGAHKRNDVACGSCHRIHQPRPTVNQPTICFACHRDVRADANKMSHHPIIEGKVKCSDCHNPHGTLAKHMLTAENTNQLCYKCHADKRGPWIWEHPPVEEDCAICHTPHGSRHESLLVEKVVNLCQNCHDSANSGDHQGAVNTAANMFKTQAATNPLGSSIRVSARGCIECHRAIHGSSNFKRSLFQ